MIIRTSKNRNYTVINNTILRDKRLTWEAKGLAAYLLSQPDDWHVNANHLWQESANGLGTVKRILQELELNGYLQRNRTRTPEGQFVWEHVLLEAPQPLDGNHTMETVEWKPVDGNQSMETIGWNPSHILSTDHEVPPLSTSTKGLSPTSGATEAQTAAVYRCWMDNMPGSMTPILQDTINGWLKDYGPDAIIKAITAAVQAGVRKPNYVNSILQREANGEDRQPKGSKAYANSNRPMSKVEASMQAVDEAFAMMRQQGMVFEGDETE